MTAPRPKRLEYAAEVGRDGKFGPAGREPIAIGEGWAAEHLVLAGLVRCTLTSFRYAAGRRNASGEGSGQARGVVTRRGEDGRYAFVEIEMELEVTVDPPPADGLDELVAHAERGCFVGASLTAKPRYRWTVNGTPVASGA